MKRRNFILSKAYLILRRKGIYKDKNMILAGYRWLMPVILVTQEAAVRRITVRSQLGQIAC
jgi:hypothetical protein